MGTGFDRGTTRTGAWATGRAGAGSTRPRRQPSRHLSGGPSLDEVSAAVGHSSPVVTKRFYDHYVRRSFSPKLRAGLGLGAQQQGGRVVPMKRSRGATK